MTSSHSIVPYITENKHQQLVIHLFTGLSFWMMCKCLACFGLHTRVQWCVHVCVCLTLSLVLIKCLDLSGG